MARQNQKRLDSLRLGGSRFGGAPDLPPELVWPTFRGKKLPFLAQIDLAELPKSILPSDGWLYVFGLYHDDYDSRPVVVLHYRGTRENLVRVGQPAREKIWTDWQREVTYRVVPLVADLKTDGKPDAEKKDWDETGHFFGRLEEYDSAESIADAQDRSGDDWITLLVIPSVGSMMWSDCGVFHIAIRRQDLTRKDFSNVCAEICCVG